MENLFDQKSYKSYLRKALGGTLKRTGLRAKAAQAMSCQTAYLSRVLNADAHLSLEQALKLTGFLGHTDEERKFFLLLVQKDRAGDRELKEYFQAQLQEILEARQLIKNRLQISEELSAAEQAKYYSRWIYSCIHIMVSIPELTTREAIAAYLDLPLKVVTEALEFLTSCGLVTESNGKLAIGKRHIHLGNNSDNIQKHHTNWRLQAMASVDRSRPEDLHYSVVFTLSRADAQKLRERILQTIQDNMKDVAPSKEEVLYCQAIDFFELRGK